MSKNKQWASKLGFIMATAGAAIGLGNLWKFPYLMGKNGGFPFLVAYLFFIVVLGLPVMITEMSLGVCFCCQRLEKQRKNHDDHPACAGAGEARIQGGSY